MRYRAAPSISPSDPLSRLLVKPLASLIERIIARWDILAALKFMTFRTLTAWVAKGRSEHAIVRRHSCVRRRQRNDPKG